MQTRCRIRRDDLGAGDAAPYRAALHRPVVESAARRGNLGFGEAAPHSHSLAPQSPIVGSTEGGAIVWVQEKLLLIHQLFVDPGPQVQVQRSRTS